MKKRTKIIIGGTAAGLLTAAVVGGGLATDWQYFSALNGTPISSAQPSATDEPQFEFDNTIAENAVEASQAALDGALEAKGLTDKFFGAYDEVAKDSSITKFSVAEERAKAIQEKAGATEPNIKEKMDAANALVFEAEKAVDTARGFQIGLAAGKNEAAVAQVEGLLVQAESNLAEARKILEDLQNNCIFNFADIMNAKLAELKDAVKANKAALADHASTPVGDGDGKTHPGSNVNGTDDAAAAAHSHKWGNWAQTKAPTCTAAGEETRVCEDPSHSDKRTVNALGHDKGAWRTVKEATYNAAGLEELFCTRCNASLGTTREIPQKTKIEGDNGNQWDSKIDAPSVPPGSVRPAPEIGDGDLTSGMIVGEDGTRLNASMTSNKGLSDNKLKGSYAFNRSGRFLRTLDDEYTKEYLDSKTII